MPVPGSTTMATKASSSTAAANNLEGFILGGDANQMAKNRVMNNGDVGIYLVSATAATVENNIVVGNEVFDLYDGSTNCGTNEWIDNTFLDANDPCIH